MMRFLAGTAAVIGGVVILNTAAPTYDQIWNPWPPIAVLALAFGLIIFGVAVALSWSGCRHG